MKLVKQLPSETLQKMEKPRFSWISPCKDCPSAWYPPDPEAIDIMKAGQLTAEAHAFACAWRPEGYCTGYLQCIHREYGKKPGNGDCVK